jgi:hypothetical protein
MSFELKLGETFLTTKSGEDWIISKKDISGVKLMEILLSFHEQF